MTHVTSPAQPRKAVPVTGQATRGRGADNAMSGAKAVDVLHGLKPVDSNPVAPTQLENRVEVHGS